MNKNCHRWLCAQWSHLFSCLLLFSSPRCGFISSHIEQPTATDVPWSALPCFAYSKCTESHWFSCCIWESPWLDSWSWRWCQVIRAILQYWLIIIYFRHVHLNYTSIDSDFVNEPVKGFKKSIEEMDPSFVVSGVARGTGSLARHTVGVSLVVFSFI